jgi:DNA-binding IclR family transcriptional regulator
LNIFEHLLKRDGNVSSNDIASQTGAEGALMYRILRYLAAHGHIDEVDADSFRANEMTRAFTMPKSMAGLKYR